LTSSFNRTYLNRMKLTTILGLFSAAGFASACATTAHADATFTSISAKVFQVSCVSCHAPMSAQDPAEGGIDYSTYATMTASNQSTTNPKHAPFIIAGDPEHSKLWLALKNGDMPQKEDGTPAPRLSDELIQNVYDWIQSGALNN
jgi:hypothetical protein